MTWEAAPKFEASWAALVHRAEQLAAQNEATHELLIFYAKLLRVQQRIYESLRGRKGWLPSGVLAEDLPSVRVLLPELLQAVAACGPALLVAEAQMLLRTSEAESDRLILAQWRAPSDCQFFAKALR